MWNDEIGRVKNSRRDLTNRALSFGGIFILLSLLWRGRSSSMVETGRKLRGGCSRATVALLGLLLVSTSGFCWAGDGDDAEGNPPALVSDRARISNITTGYVAIDDFERIFYVKPAQDVTTIGRSNGIQTRAFVSATVYYEPDMRVQDVIRYVGGDTQSTYDLVAMRCRPPDSSKTQAILATWPNVFKALVTDLGSQYTPSVCPASWYDAVDKQVYCSSLSFSDQANSKVPVALAAAMNAGADIFRLTGGAFQPTGSTNGADLLYDLYGIGYGFSGLGFSVKDSYLGGQSLALTAAQALEQSVVPEYLVANLTLAEGGCSCVRVKPYAGRDQGFIDWDRVRSEGSEFTCPLLDRLPGHRTR